MYKYTSQAALSLGDVADVKNASGVQGMIRYNGPKNGGMNDASKADYGALLKVFLASKSFRYFSDTYLTCQNIVALLGARAPEVQQLKTRWYCFRVKGCTQENSHFPINVWLKKKEFWEDDELQDGLFLTMKESMSTPPVQINNYAEETAQGPWKSTRKPVGIAKICGKTNGCKFTSKSEKAMREHENECRPKAPAANLVCKIAGCKFVTPHKSALTKHMKKCGAHPESEVFACSHQGCGILCTSKKECAAHERTHMKVKATADKVAANNKLAADKAAAAKAAAADKAAANRSKKARVEVSPAATLVAETKLFGCPHCPKVYPTSELAEYHQKRKHAPTSSLLQGAPSVLYRCLECSKSFTSAELWRLHQQSHQSCPPRQSVSSGMYLCPECLESHDSPELARLHQQKHQTRQSRPTVEVETVMCTECKVYSGTPLNVLAHVLSCRASLTCPQCHTKCDSQAFLMAHVLQCVLRGEPVNARKRPRENDDGTCKPTRNKNRKHDVMQHWQRIHVNEWLELVELEDYKEAFLKQQVDGRILLKLSKNTIKGKPYNMTKAHAKKFLSLLASFE